MEHVSFNAKTKSIELKKSPIPKPAEDEVLVRVAYAGVCGTDLHIIEGSFPCKDTTPVTLGHEFSGVIEAVGKFVTVFKVGDPVTVNPNDGCNLCHECHSGKYHLCNNGGVNNAVGIFRDGGWSTHCVAPASLVHHVPKGVLLAQAALCEPLSCLAHGWEICAPINVGEKVLILGAGIIGLLWASVLHLHGLRKTVTISEPQEKRREMVRKLGLGYEVKSPNELQGREFDFIVDCSGSGVAIESAIDLLGLGGRFCIFGVSNPKTRVSFSPFQMYKKELKFMGANVNPFTFPKAIGMLTAMADDYLLYDKLGIKMYKLSQHKEALEALSRGDISKAVFKIHEL